MRTEGRAGRSESIAEKKNKKNQTKSDGVIEEGQFVISTILKRGKFHLQIISEWGKYIHNRKLFLTLRQQNF